MTSRITAPFDVEAVRADFPLLQQQVHGHPLAYLDSTATAQKPQAVLDAMDSYYRTTNANVHRGVYTLAEQATELYEQSRRTIGRFIGAGSTKEVIFTRNATESINLVAQSWGRANLKPGDRLLLTVMEHHSNLVPWQLIAEQTGAAIDYLRLDEQGRLRLDDLETLLTERTRMVAVTQMSNVLGVINPVAEIVARAHAVGALVLVDGAQSVAHMPIDVRALGVDFFAFSGHKMCGPMGIGVLWGRRELLEAMPPFMGGGDMISSVKLEGSTWNALPYKFEAGTPAVAEAVGLAAAVSYLQGLGMEAIHQREFQLVRYAMERLADIPELTIYGPSAEERGGVLSFTLGDIHPHDIAAVLDRAGVAVRAGHHCAQPLHDLLGLSATARASFYLYTTEEEIDRLAEGLERCRSLLAI